MSMLVFECQRVAYANMLPNYSLEAKVCTEDKPIRCSKATKGPITRAGFNPVLNELN